MADRTYRVVVEGTVTTNMTMKEIKEETSTSVMGFPLENQKVTVERVPEKATKRRKP